MIYRLKKFYKNSKIVDIALAFCVSFYFFHIFFKYTINIPVNDDYDVIENFTNFINATNFNDKFKLFYLQHNEHRILYDKLWFYISYLLDDNGLNFNFLSFIANLSLVFLVIFYYLKLKNKFPTYLIAFPISVLILNLTFWENITFSMAGLCNFSFILFAVISLHYLTKNDNTKRDIFLSILFFSLSLFTQGGGLLLFPVLLLILLLKKNLKLLRNYIVPAVFIIILYFINYHKYPSPQISEILKNGFLHIKYFLTFLGNAVANYHFFPDNNDQAIIRSLILGTFFILAYIYLLVKKYYIKNLFNFSVMTFIIIVAIITSINRLSQGMSSAVSSRYRLTSVLFLISILICAFEFFKTKRYKNVYVNSSIMVFSAIYLFYFNFNATNEFLLSFRKNTSNLGALFYLGGDNSLINSSKPDFAANVMQFAKSSKTYILDSEMIDNYYRFAKIQQLGIVNDNPSIIGSANIVRVNKLSNSFYIDGYAFINDMDTNDQSVYIILLGAEGQQKIFSAQSEPRPGLSSYFNVKNVNSGGFYIKIRIEDLSLGENKVYVLIRNKVKNKVIKTDKIIIKE